MTDTSPAPFGQKPPFGVGRIVSESFSLFFSRFGTFFILALVPQVVVGLIQLLLGWDVFSQLRATMEMMQNPAAFDPEAAGALGGMFSFSAIGNQILALVASGVATALLVLAAYDAKTGHPPRIGTYVSIMMSRLVPVIAVAFIVGLAVGIGAIFLIIPGLWLLGVLSCAVVVTVLESKGIGESLSRSAELTQEYRWPIVGTLVIVILLVSIAVAIVTGLLLSIVGGMLLSMGFVGALLGVLILALLGAFTSGITAAAYTLIYARLREIKEGVGIDSLQDVFR